MTEMTPVTQTATATKAVPALPDAQTVTEVKHYTDRLFSFKMTRPVSMRFRSGEFVMIGLMGDVNPKTGKQKDHAQIHRLARIPKRAISHDHNRGLVGVDTCTGAAEGEKPEKFG